MFIAWLHFLALYLITGALIRLFTMKFPDNPAAKAMTFAH